MPPPCSSATTADAPASIAFSMSSFTTRDLFFNTPARLKFMKSDSAEGAAAAGVIAQIALSHPDFPFICRLA